MQTFQGICENGVVRLLSPVPWPDGTKVTIVVEASEQTPPIGCNSAELSEILSRTNDTGETDLAARVDELDP